MMLSKYIVEFSIWVPTKPAWQQALTQKMRTDKRKAGPYVGWTR